MTKSEIIRFLRNLPIQSIKFLDVVYHKTTFNGSAYFRLRYPLYDDSCLAALYTMYKLRGNIRSIHAEYIDKNGCRQILDYLAKDTVRCKSLSDFINFKK